MSTFSEFKLLPAIQRSLDALGFTEPTEIQEKSIPMLIENPNQDVHGQAQTGTGKTLAFGIPLLQNIDPSLKKVQALIVAPTRELVLQIQESLVEVSRDTGISIEPIYGGMPIERQMERIRRGAQIIVGTPGRLNDHLRRRTLSLGNLKTFVLDEADIMLDMGFKEEIDEMLTLAPADRNIWLFSATVLPGIKQLITSHMKDVVTVRATKKSVVSSQVEQYYCVVSKKDRIEAAARFIAAAPDFYGIIFCQTKLLTAEVMEQLASKGFRANCLHGDMKQSLRNQVIKGFKNKDFNILVATDVAARGIDVSNLTHVINFSIPDEHENYIHRIGRTGRAGKEGTAIVLVSASERYRLKRLEKATNSVLQEIPVPPQDAIINAKMSGISDFIEQAKQSAGKQTAVYKVLRELINSFSEEEIRQSFTAALEDMFFKGMAEEIGSVSADSMAAPQEICIEIGREDGYSENDLRSYLYATCTLLPQEVRKVRVLGNKTFILIPENRLHECVNLLKANPIDQKKYKLYLVEDVYRNDNRSSDRGDRGGSRGRERSSYRGGSRGGDRGGRDSRPPRRR